VTRSDEEQCRKGEKHQQKHQEAGTSPSARLRQDSHVAAGSAEESRAQDLRLPPPPPNEIVPEHPSRASTSRRTRDQPTPRGLGQARSGGESSGFPATLQVAAVTKRAPMTLERTSLRDYLQLPLLSPRARCSVAS
jgi:hypothetical protein